jgi:hypothetical protein
LKFFRAKRKKEAKAKVFDGKRAKTVGLEREEVKHPDVDLRDA